MIGPADMIVPRVNRRNLRFDRSAGPTGINAGAKYDSYETGGSGRVDSELLTSSATACPSSGQAKNIWAIC